MEKKSIINVDGRFYYGWVMLICGFMTMFICYVIKATVLPYSIPRSVKNWA